jgi:ferredoxin--NADP+ reductase
METSSRSAAELQRLRDEQYNARVEHMARLHADLMVLRIRPDFGLPDFCAGQYIALALGNWEPCIDGLVGGYNASRGAQLIKRAYSISCSLLDEHGRLVCANQTPYLEFYIALVRRSADGKLALTPRLFALTEGDRLYCAGRAHGSYSLKLVQPDDDVVFAATGTGEAPHNAMLADLLAGGHRGKIASVVCVRKRRDLAYGDVHRQLQDRYRNYRYITLTTREPENVDSARANYVGKRYLQDYFASGEFEHGTGIRLRGSGVHIYLCGNPAMIGAPRHTSEVTQRYSQPLGMVELLEGRGLRIDRPHEPGNIHFEKYW